MFGQAMKAAITAASTDTTLPLLNAVKVKPGEVMATDRFRLVRSKYTMEQMNSEKTDFEPYLISLADAKKLVDLGNLVSLDLDDDGWLTITAWDGKGLDLVKRIVRVLDASGYPPG